MVCQTNNHNKNSISIRICSLFSDWISSQSITFVFSSLVLFLVLGATGIQALAQAYTYEVNTIPLKGELINFSGLSILQDSEGFIWFGSEDGLYRYHGSGVRAFRKEFQNPGSLREDKVFELFEDSDGDIWVGTDRGLYRFEKFTETFTKYQNASYEIHDFVEDKDGYLWFSTIGGIVRFDKTSGLVKKYPIRWKQSTPYEIPYYVNDLYLDRENCLWICGNDELRRFDIETESMEIITNAFQTLGFCEDQSGRVWIAGSKGLYLFDRKHKTLIRHSEEHGNINSPLVQYISSLLEDKSGNIWIRTYEGIYCYDQNLELKYHWEHTSKYSDTYPYRFLFRPLMEDNTGTIWFYSPDGMHQINRKPTNFRSYDFDPDLQQTITCLLIENNDLIWFGTFQGLSSLDRETNTVTTHIDSLSHGSNPYAINSIYMDRNGSVWLGTSYNGLIEMRRTEDSIIHFERHLPDLIDSTWQYKINLTYITHIFEDSKGRLWISGVRGSPCYYDKQENRFIRLVENSSSGEKLPEGGQIQIRHETTSNILWATGGAGVYKILPPFTRIDEDAIMASELIHCQAVNSDGTVERLPRSITSYMDSTGNIWLGTENSGLVRLTIQGQTVTNGKEFEIKSFTTDHGLPSNEVVSIIDDGSGNLWLGTANGLSKFNLQSETFTSFYARHGLSNNIFWVEAAKINESGEVFFGTWNGIISFYPDSLHINQFIAPVKLTEFRIHNQTVSPGENSVLQRSITHSESIDLRHHQDYLSFEFAILNYLDPELNQYKYMLEGLDQDWVYSGSRNFANYSNLKPGEYTFKVTGSNNDGIWNEEGTSLHIFIHPPPWQSWWAYVIYCFVIAGIIILIRQYLLNQEKLRTAVEIERIEKERMEELDHMRSRFFANVSHEFRTPLTLLTGPIEELKKNLPGLSNSNMNLLQLMKRNVRRLQHLVNQLLDISKLEKGKVKIRASEGNLTEFIRTVGQSFRSLAESKKISYEYDLPEWPGMLYFDNDKLEKILSNLISNAFKFTPEKGTIKIGVRYIMPEKGDAPKFVQISVRDTGRGIPEEAINRVFDRFYQVSDPVSGEQEGIGIGLALTKELVELHRGEIRVESEIGKGSTFTVKLPVSKVLFSEDEIVAVPSGKEKEAEGELIEMDEQEHHDFQEAQPGTKSDGKPHILIVEDHADLRNYISRILVNTNRITVAENGREGLLKATEMIPDLVITDLMMPEMDGMEMCDKMKNDDRTSHIPVIMLTARADRDSKLKGLETGADDYLIKPFDAEELLVRTRNLIEQRKKLREIFQKEFRIKPIEETMGIPGDKLLHRVLDILSQHINDPQYNVDHLTGELNMSRSQMYRKIGALTGNGPGELFRNLRLKKAAELILTGKQNITQIMYEVGFQSTSNFARQFKEYFGVNPSGYKRSVLN